MRSKRDTPRAERVRPSITLTWNRKSQGEKTHLPCTCPLLPQVKELVQAVRRGWWERVKTPTIWRCLGRDLCPGNLCCREVLWGRSSISGCLSGLPSFAAPPGLTWRWGRGRDLLMLQQKWSDLPSQCNRNVSGSLRRLPRPAFYRLRSCSWWLILPRHLDILSKPSKQEKEGERDSKKW